MKQVDTRWLVVHMLAVVAASVSVRRSIPSQLGVTIAKLTRSFTEAGQEAGSRLLPTRRNLDCPRAIKKPDRWLVLRTRSRRDMVQPGRWAHNPTAKAKSSRGAGGRR
ncbi:hypothetical protein ACIGDI_40070 [Streptomyces sp. NPDC085900]|uniref:hypothetical protein n=1 Tax=Streptomyces sp. NPDC085900 TaxID=3365737 RepID=UPI0037D5E3CF